MKNCALRLIRADEGVTSIEYGLIAGIIVVAIVGILPLIGGSVSGMFEAVLGGFDKP